MGQEPPEGYPRIPENSGGGAGNPEDLERSRAEQQQIWENMAARLSAERGHPVSVAEAKAELQAELSPKP
jgi:hypothetical protein